MPPKVRKMNTGTFYGVFLHNDGTVNAGNTLSVDITFENSFDEVPSSIRLPYLS